MSNIASPAAGGSATITQSGTVPANTTPIDQGVGVDQVDNDNDSDVDSLFGDISELNEILKSASKDDNNGSFPSKGNTPDNADQSEISESDAFTTVGNAHQTPVKETISIPTISPLTFPTGSPKSNHTDDTTSTHEEFPNRGSASNTAIAVNQTTVGNGVAHAGNVPAIRENKNSPTQIPIATPELVASTGCLSDSPGDFSSLPNGTIPKADFNGSVLFGPELQQALFEDGEASADPKLPRSNTASGPIPDITPPVQTTLTIAEEETVAPVTPQRPPATPPRMVNIPMSRPPTSHDYDGPTTHNAMPTKPDTPLADQLRADFWDWHRQEKQTLFEYKKAYRDWALFTRSEDNKAKADYEPTAEQLKSSAIANQTAWTKLQQSFDQWKAENPAAAPIIANVHEEMKALKAAENQKAECEAFVQDLRGKSEEQRQHELSRYDNFTHLMKQSRERELWRSRVDTQVKAQAIIEAQRQAVVDEQNRIVAEEARKRAEAEAEEARKKAEAEAEEERKKKEAEAEEERKRAEAQAAEETRLLGERMLSALLKPNGSKMRTSCFRRWGFQRTTSRRGDSDNFEQQFQEAFQLQDDANMQFNEPLNFEGIVANQEAQLHASNQPEVDFTAPVQPDAALAQPLSYSESLRIGDQALMSQAYDARAQEFFSADVQAQFPSISEVMTTPAGAAAHQPAMTTNAIPVETPTGKKKPRARKKKATTKAQLRNDADSQSALMPMPNAAQQQMTASPFGLDQAVASDPFSSSASSQHLPDNGQGMFSIRMPGVAQTSEVVSAAVPQTAQMPVMNQASSEAAGPIHQQLAKMATDYSMFMHQPSQTPSSASRSATRSPPSTHVSTHPTPTPSSDNKRKAPAAHGTETPTKRRQSVNQQGALVPIAQPPPVPSVPQGFQNLAHNSQAPTQSIHSPAPSFQTPQQIPIDPALHFGISPPSGGSTFGTAIKAGVCAVVGRIRGEVKRQGTALSHMLIDGPTTDFSGPETGTRIKQATKHLLAEAFINGAYKILQTIVQEAEVYGSVFGKQLLLGPITGSDLVAAKKAMVVIYKEVSAAYTAPPAFDLCPARSAQLQQQTPTRARPAPAHGSGQNGMANRSSTSSPHLPRHPLAPGTPVPGRTGSPQMNGHAASSSPMQAFPTLPAHKGCPSPMNGYATPAYQQPPTASSSPMQAFPTLPAHNGGCPSPLNGYATSAYPDSPGPGGSAPDIPEPTNSYPLPQQQQQPVQQKKTPAPRKSRARKPPTTQDDDNNTPTTTPATTPAPITTTTTAVGGPGQCIPRIYYRFSDAAFYMQLRADNNNNNDDINDNDNDNDTATHHHRMGRGTAASEAELARFLAAAHTLGMGPPPAGFVFRLWVGMERNLEALGRLVLSS
ncbi:hypothetical protein C8A00DRAFT_43278 [Chaetomidium leptoderma]|uniref:Uncharacterized protein n=1 Tax=Chaetomidium leptoderma TaxID=669021 RepID=A0AAN6VP74_9PEZI|nr:hypothetical protein C8A00DRAFT_43278 [Chaetomidium leptoderma]